MNSNDFYKLLSGKKSDKKYIDTEDDYALWYKVTKDNEDFIIVDEYVENITKVMAYTDKTKESEEDVSENYNLDGNFTYFIDVTDFDFNSNHQCYWKDDSNIKHYISSGQIQSYVINGEDKLLVSTGENVVDTIYAESDVLNMVDVNFDKKYINLGNVTTFDDLNNGQNAYTYENDGLVSTVTFTSKDVIYDDGNYFLPVDEDKNVVSITINGNSIPFSAENLRIFLYDVDSFNLDVADIASGTVKIIGQQQEEIKTITTDDLVTINEKIYFKSETLLNNCSLEINGTNAGDLNLNGSIISLDHISDYLESEFVVGFYGGNEMMCGSDDFVVIDKKTYLFVENAEVIQRVQYGTTTTEEKTIYFDDSKIKIKIEPANEQTEQPYNVGYIVMEPIHPLDLYPTKKWWQHLSRPHTYDNQQLLYEHKYFCEGEEKFWTNVSCSGFSRNFQFDSKEFHYTISYDYDSENDIYVSSMAVKDAELIVSASVIMSKKITPILAMYEICGDNEEKTLFTSRYYEISHGKVTDIWKCDDGIGNALVEDRRFVQYAWGEYQSYCEGLRKETKLLKKYVKISRDFPNGKWENIVNEVHYSQEPIEDSECSIFKTFHTKTIKLDYNSETTIEEAGGGIVGLASEKWICKKNVPKPEDDEECPEDDCKCYLAVYASFKSCSSSGETASVNFDNDYKFEAYDVTEQQIKGTFESRLYEYEISPPQDVSLSRNHSDCYYVHGKEYKRQYVGMIYAEDGSKHAWQIFYDNFTKLSYNLAPCAITQCKCKDGEVMDRIPIGVTNSENPTLDLPSNVGKKYAGATVLLHEVSGGVTYGEGTIDDNGNIVGLPTKFESQYSYNGYMYYLVIYCKKSR